jgi:hypothetical protein
MRGPGMNGGRVLGLGLLLSAIASPAQAEGIRFGLRAGQAQLDGTLHDLDLEESEERIFGLQAIFPLVADRFALQVTGEGISDELELSGEGLDDAVRGRIEWQEFALYATARAELIPVGFFGLYGGGGLGVHFSELDGDELRRVLEEAGAQIEDELDGESSELEWHAVAGLDLRLAATLELFGEGRYRSTHGDVARDGFAGYVGLNLRLP